MSALLDTQGIAEMFDLSRRHVTNVIIKRPDFPAPVVNISRRTRYWSEADVRKFALATGGRKSAQASRGSSVR
ncbi:hypothetical protein [Brachymonas wangyanguii]|uniref:hypothetical protein n=1 Tax=Brachymonas wangyanguii TaxID=3130163 RepID=UPI00307F7C0E